MPPTPPVAPAVASTREPRQSNASERKRTAEDSSDTEQDLPLKKHRKNPPQQIKAPVSVAQTPKASASRPHRTIVSEEDDSTYEDTESVDIDSNAKPTKAAESPEKELERLMKIWTAPVYAFFQPMPEIEIVNGRRSHVFKCFGRECTKTVRRFLDTRDRNSTSNLITHVRSCKSWGKAVWEAAREARDADDARENVAKPVRMSGSITDACQVRGKYKPTYSHRQRSAPETRAEIVRWFSENFRPFDTVEDRGFQSLMKTGRPDYYIPSAATVSRDVKHVFAKCRTRIAKLLREYDGDLHFATDAWTSPYQKAYVGITVHFQKDGHPMALVLDVVEVPKSHSGINLAAAFRAAMMEFGIKHKILGITANNAPNNDTMVEELEFTIDKFSADNRLRCFLHVIDLIAESFLNHFDVKKKRGDAVSGDDAELDEMVEQTVPDGGQDNEIDDDLDSWVEEADKLSDEERHQLLESIKATKRVLFKLSKLADAIINSTTILSPAWVQKLEELEVLFMPQDIRARWNSTYDMCNFVQTHRDVIEKEHNLRKYHLGLHEWDIVEQLSRVLKILKDATLFFSRSEPNVASVIPAMDTIHNTFNEYVVSRDLDPAIRAAVATARKTLRHYYSLTNMSEPHVVAMILHPRRKLHYFEKQGRRRDWIEKAELVLRDKFERSYAELVVEDKEIVVDKDAKGKGKADINIFDTMDEDSPYSQLDNEISRYLQAPSESPENVLLWWIEHRKVYPRLSKMALDYLTVPATCVDVSRLFSKGRPLLSHIHNRLSVQSTRALLCLNSWSLAGLVDDKDITAVVVEPELEKGVGEPELKPGWDAIQLE